MVLVKGHRLGIGHGCLEKRDFPEFRGVIQIGPGQPEADRIVLKNIAAQSADKTAQGLTDYFQNQ